MNCPKAALFDLDDTLAESFRPPKPETLDKLRRLLDYMPCAIITAAGFARVQEQILPEIEKSKNVWRFYVFPNSAAECYSWDGESWQRGYTFALTHEERLQIADAIQKDAKSIVSEDSAYKWRIIDREAQIAFAAIGLDAPLEQKKAWDPDQTKRTKLKKMLEKQLPEFEVLIGGMTTIDITRKGINKAYGVEWMAKKFDCAPGEMLYVGDALYPGGNDYVVIPTGVKTRMVTGPADTSVVLDELLKICNS